MARRRTDAVDLKPYSKFILEYKMRAEYNLLRSHGPPGMYVLSTSSPFRWDGVLFIREGLYKGAVLKFTVDIPSSFPDGVCPVVQFQPAVLHPQVSMETGEVSVADRFLQQHRGPYHVYHVLEHVRTLFYQMDHHSPANQEAADLWCSDQERFKEAVADSVEACSAHCVKGNSLDGSVIQLSAERWSVEVMRRAREDIFEREEDISRRGPEDARTCGLSWVEPDTHKPFSKYR